MYAIIATGGKQYKVQPGQIIDVETVEDRDGRVVFDTVLLCSGDDGVAVGSPTVEGAEVTGELVATVKGEKVVAFKKRRRKDSQTKRGHRQVLSRVRIDEIKTG
ncbi:MAG: 50S ribosomal protein L21 [Planctomycetota bacterium]